MGGTLSYASARRPAPAAARFPYARRGLGGVHPHYSRFLAEEDILAFRRMVQDGLSQVKNLLGVRGPGQEVVGFMAVEGDKLEMLFMHPDWRRAGVGRRLVEYAVGTLGVRAVDVNEQNTQAVGFYLKMGFEVTGRSALDGTGRPYPLLHLWLAGARPGLHE